ncbi:MAG: AraC family transcriptional regulator [Chitinophagaceae bacterium]
MNHLFEITGLPHEADSKSQLFIRLEPTVLRMPGFLEFSIHRYVPTSGHFTVKEMGILLYHSANDNPGENHLELHYCVEGTITCGFENALCYNCQDSLDINCQKKISTIDIVKVIFSEQHLSQYILHANQEKNRIYNILSFKNDGSFRKSLTLCVRTKLVLEGLVSHSHTTGFLENVFGDAQCQLLLLFALESIQSEQEDRIFECKFLANEIEREKVIQSREILLQHVHAPLTVRDLSKKVGINQCYLKKGFKELFGTTITEFQQELRMERARFCCLKGE